MLSQGNIETYFYEVGTEYIRVQSSWELNDWTMHLPKPIILACIYVYSYPIGWIEGYVRQEKITDPVVLSKVKRLSQEYQLKPGELVYANDKMFTDAGRVDGELLVPFEK